eukprot:TRINITY_DN38615_c0_g1_i1.p1 TRINITY_DN38615_c0_g1~~TRINITY_DN38615_c0_g1_i1.p1  ORF type:complete len:939 (-),score=103.93 TRINITY_DN38615_c0_g1_i1:365-3181(-)
MRRAFKRARPNWEVVWSKHFSRDARFTRKEFLRRFQEVGEFKRYVQGDLGDVFDALKGRNSSGDVESGELSKDEFVRGMEQGVGRYPLASPRCAFFGEIDHGKTTLMEALLNEAGAEYLRRSLSNCPEHDFGGMTKTLVVREKWWRASDLAGTAAEGSTQCQLLIDTPGVGDASPKTSVRDVMLAIDRLFLNGRYSRVLIIHDATRERFSMAEDVLVKALRDASSRDREAWRRCAFLVLTKWDRVEGRTRDFFRPLAEKFLIDEKHILTSSIPKQALGAATVGIEEVRNCIKHGVTEYGVKLRPPTYVAMLRIAEGLQGGNLGRINQRLLYVLLFLLAVMMLIMIYALIYELTPCQPGWETRPLSDLFHGEPHCVRAACNVDNSDRSPGTACRCLDGFAGSITWIGANSHGSCKPAPCDVENAAGVGLSCACMDGYDGSISWSGDHPFGRCLPAACDVENSTGIGPACRCINCFFGHIAWNGSKASGACSPAACDIEGSNKARGPACRCLDSYSGDVTWHGPHVSGNCSPASCGIKDSNHLPGPWCECKHGFRGKINWWRSKPVGICEIECPADGYIVKDYDKCLPVPCSVPHSNGRPGFDCGCSDGYKGSITWKGSETHGTCRPAPCNGEGLIGEGPACRCADGYTGHVTWDGSEYHSTCRPAKCNISYTFGAGTSCQCEYPLNGSVSWNGDVCVANCTYEGRTIPDDNQSCFPGEALVTVAGQNGDASLPIAKVRTGDIVRGAFGFEPILGFLHVVEGMRGAYLRVQHVHGEMRLSPNHLIFVVRDAVARQGAVQAAELRVGDKISAAQLHETQTSLQSFEPSVVLAIRREQIASGMYAPLTASGTIVVDKVVASTYAMPSWLDSSIFSHRLMHCFFFPYRSFHLVARYLFRELQPLELDDERGGNVHVGPVEYVHPYIRGIVLLGSFFASNAPFR